MGRNVVGAAERLGTTAIDCDGSLITVVEYVKYSKVLVEWCDGERKWTTWRHILDSRIKKPTSRVNTCHTNSAGETVTVVRYASSKEVEVAWEDGATGVFTWASLIKGQFRKPLDTRIGKVMKCTQGDLFTVVEWVNSSRVKIQWAADGNTSWHQWSHISRGMVSNPRRLVVGVGIEGKRFPEDQEVRSAWSRMLNRVYNRTFTDKQPTYKNVKVSDELKDYANFYKVYTNLIGYGNSEFNLDKDILSAYYGFSVPTYSATTLAMVPRRINSIVIPREVGVGVHKRGSNFTANYCGKSLGSFSNEEEAHSAYLKAKKDDLESVIAEYRDKLDPIVVKALEGWEF